MDRGPSARPDGHLRGYGSTRRPTTLRIAVAVLLCGIAASILVALIAAIAIFAGGLILQLAGLTRSGVMAGDGMLAGAAFALMVAAFNWIMFYIVVPVTWLVLAASLGTFPYRRILSRRPYLKWATIWGALLVGGVTTMFGLGESVLTGLGALVTGAATGALAGYVCGHLFLAIARPHSHLAEHTADIF